MGEDAAVVTNRHRGGMFIRGGAELLVVIVGVVIGLAVDRWMAGVDERVQAERLTERLLADIRADSAQLEELSHQFEMSADSLLAAAELIADPQAPLVDPTSFIQTIEFAGWWLPFRPNTITWDEVNSLGQLGLFGPDMRTSLARYYESLGVFRDIEDRWAGVFQEYWSLQTPVLPPLTLIAAVDQQMGLPRGRRLTSEEVGPVLAAFRRDAALRGALGRLVGVYRYGGAAVRDMVTSASATIAALESRQK
jgi:hypothetical protein